MTKDTKLREELNRVIENNWHHGAGEIISWEDFLNQLEALILEREEKAKESVLGVFGAYFKALDDEHNKGQAIYDPVQMAIFKHLRNIALNSLEDQGEEGKNG